MVEYFECDIEIFFSLNTGNLFIICAKPNYQIYTLKHG
jgi:hypothetical protein